jgi:hypothetical protein
VFHNNTHSDISDKDIWAALKLVATALDYPATHGIPIKYTDTHSLHIGRTNVLSLAGYSDSQIQKLGRWHGETFKEYVWEQLSNFSQGMSTSMRRPFALLTWKEEHSMTILTWCSYSLIPLLCHQ